MIKIAEDLHGIPSPLWTLVRQCGVRYVVGNLPWETPPPDAPWDFMPLLRMKERFESAGFQLAVIESRPPLEREWQYRLLPEHLRPVVVPA
jgi:mannonate dehydratase